MVLAVEIDPLPVIEAIRASADVVVDDPSSDDLYALVTVARGMMPVARLYHNLTGSSDEGRVLREVMLTTTGLRRDGTFIWWRPGCPRRC